MTQSPEDQDEFLQIYLEESEEESEQLVELLLKLEQSPDDDASLREAFRLLHTFKGSSGMMGYERITGLAHELETRFDAYREGRERLSPEIVSVTLRCIDFFRAFVERLREGGTDQGDPRDLIDELRAVAARPVQSPKPSPPAPDPSAASKLPAPSASVIPTIPVDANLTEEKPLSISPDSKGGSSDSSDEQFDRLIEEQLQRELAGTSATSIETIPTSTARSAMSSSVEGDVSPAGIPTLESKPPVAPEAKPNSRPSVSSVPMRSVVICVRLSGALELPELKARLVLAKLQSHGEVLGITPSLAEIDEFNGPVTLRVKLRSTRNDAALIEAVDMEGVDAIYFGDSSSEGFNSPETRTDIVASRDIASAERTTEATANVVESADANSGGDSTARTRASETIRVGIDRLDRLMNLAGELAVTNARFAQLADEMRMLFRSGRAIEAGSPLAESLLAWLGGNDDTRADAEEAEHSLGDTDPMARRSWIDRGKRVASHVSETVDQLSRLSKRLQHAVLETRMVPVSPLFNRFRRTVRDLSLRQGKQVRLEIAGESTELDKRMVDELGDPMIHLIRNALDHGIERPEVRESRGKVAEGVIRLRAFHQSNHVVIEISDDGNGIDSRRIRARALERGLATASELDSMSDTDVYSFIWQPGFSTAESVSDLSGRGVGMDVVKERIATLGGAVELDSRPGRGSTVTLRLPLTLAIVNSLIVRFRGFRMAIPVTDVCEVIGVDRSEVFVAQNKEMVDLRGELVPLYRIDQLYNWSDALPPSETPPPSWVQAVLVRDGHRMIAIEVEDLEGNSDVVIKSLDQHFSHIQGLAGASVLGDGGVCLVIDAASLEVCRSNFKTAPKLSR